MRPIETPAIRVVPIANGDKVHYELHNANDEVRCDIFDTPITYETYELALHVKRYLESEEAAPPPYALGGFRFQL